MKSLREMNYERVFNYYYRNCNLADYAAFVVIIYWWIYSGSFNWKFITENWVTRYKTNTKTAEEILKGKLNPAIAILNNPDYTFNKVIEAMEEYANQFRQQPVVKQGLPIEFVTFALQTDTVKEMYQDWKVLHGSPAVGQRSVGKARERWPCA